MSRVYLTGVFVLLLLSFLSTEVSAQIQFDQNGRWGTSFDWSEPCSPRGHAPNTVNCSDIDSDGIDTFQGVYDTSGGLFGGYYSMATTDAARVRGMGWRTWKNDGSNRQTVGVSINLPDTFTEVWLSWYMRWEEGFTWENGQPHYDKLTRLRTDTSHNIIPGLGSGTFRIRPEYAILGSYNSDGMYSWSWLNGGSTLSTGKWHYMEVYLKMDSGGAGYGERRSDGVVRFWVNNTLVVDEQAANFSGADQVALRGWRSIVISGNQNNPDNGRPMYVDYDDVVIYVQEPPNTDANGNPFIGPAGGGGTVSPGPSPAPPSSVTIRPPTGIAVY